MWVLLFVFVFKGRVRLCSTPVWSRTHSNPPASVYKCALMYLTLGLSDVFWWSGDALWVLMPDKSESFIQSLGLSYCHLIRVSPSPAVITIPSFAACGGIENLESCIPDTSSVTELCSQALDVGLIFFWGAFSFSSELGSLCAAQAVLELSSPASALKCWLPVCTNSIWQLSTCNTQNPP